MFAFFLEIFISFLIVSQLLNLRVEFFTNDLTHDYREGAVTPDILEHLKRGQTISSFKVFIEEDYDFG
jgi:hypothetical protein